MGALKYKNLISLIIFTNQKKILNMDIKKYLKIESMKKAIVLYNPPIKDIVRIL